MNATRMKPEGKAGEKGKRKPEPLAEGPLRMDTDRMRKDFEIGERISGYRESKDKGALPELTELLGYDEYLLSDIGVRLKAFNAIIEIGLDEKTIGAMEEVVEKDDVRTYMAASILAWDQDERGLEALCRGICRRGEFQVKHAFMFNPERFGDDEKRRVVELIGHDEQEVRAGAYRILEGMVGYSRLGPIKLAEMARDHAMDDNESILQALWVVSQKIGMDEETARKVTAELLEAYAHAEHPMVAKVLNCWIVLNDHPDAIQFFKLEAVDIQGEDDWFRRNAIAALIELSKDHGKGNEAFFETILELSAHLPSEDLLVARRALNGLGVLHRLYRIYHPADPIVDALCRLHKGMLSNPSRGERMLMTESFQALVRSEADRRGK